MIHISSILPAGVVAACLLVPTAFLAAADDVASPAKEAIAPAAAQPKRELSPALAALRDQVRRTLAMHRKQPFNTRENSATEIMNYCLAFGCGTEVALEGSNGKRVNGITCLCWDYPCAGFDMLGLSQKHIAVRIGYGYQEHPGEFLAMLAMSRVQPDYPVRTGKDVRTVADLIEAEKLGCRSGNDMSLKLIGLSYYVDEPEWQNDLGETWSIDRILKEEVAQPVIAAPEGGLNRLMGLSYAVARRAKRGQPIDGQFERAQKYTTDFQEFALQLQNSDGSWGPYFLAARSTSPDAASQLRSTGRVLEWLALALPDKRLEDARVIGAVEYVNRLLGSQRYQGSASSLSTREIASVGHALHALNMYDERVFKPADAPAEKPAADNSPTTAASRDTSSSKSR
jgi:hypothetical protein